MDVIATDDRPKPKPLSSYGGPPPSPVHCMPPLEVSHGLPSHSLYESHWRSFPPALDGPSSSEQRRHSTPSQQLPIPPQSLGYPPPPNRELPQISPPDAPLYVRSNALPVPPTHSPDVHPPHANYRSMNGAAPDTLPPPGPGEYRSRIGYPPHEAPTNGEQQPPPPPPQPPPPSLAPGQYAPGVPPIPATSSPYEASYYHGQMFGTRQRKAARAQQACDQCRARKAKCDEGRPSCSHCKENSLTCVYKEIPPHKQEKATQLVLDKLQQLEDRMTQMQSIQADQGQQIKQLLSTRSRSPAPESLKEAPGSKSVRSHDSSVERSIKSDLPDRQTLVGRESKEDVIAPRFVTLVAHQQQNHRSETKDEDDGELSIPVEHTTAAHKLLLWPSIKRILAPKEIDEDYVMKLEEDRGLIRVYGRGEGDDRSDYDRSAASPSTTNSSSPCWEDDYAQAASSPTPIWGTGLPVVGSSYRPRDQVGGLDESGQLNTDAETVRRLHRSYLQHIHILHPFLDEATLQRKVDRFLKIYSTPKKALGAQFLQGGAGEPPRGAKRKRSSETLLWQDMQPSPGSNSERTIPWRIEKSIENAAILLVLALGAICEWRDKPLPGPARDYQPDVSAISTVHSVLSPAMSDSAVDTFCSPSSHSFPSPTAGDASKMTPARSISAAGLPGRDGADFSNPRNMDIIPGLAYYAYATDILGNLQGGNDLPHVQAALLAGLYAGQLAHPFQSHGWISQASRACQVLVRTKRYEKMPHGPRRDLIEFAYWTCLQLESDILAELDLPASGISRAESRIHLPKGVYTITLPNEIRAPTTMMMIYYSAQIHLRKVLNRVHTDLYKAEKKGEPTWSTSVQEALSVNLESWRENLPDIMKWKDDEEPASDINTARLRAKYYGARYIIHRPLLYHALHHFKGPSEPSGRAASSPISAVLSGSKSQQMSPSVTHCQRSTSMPRFPSSDMGPPGRTPSTPGETWPSPSLSDLTPKLLRACQKCVSSAILSTEAFDGVKERPVVTNIFGTAHAQFGNMLVLSATHMSSLSELVNRGDLQRLLKRTIDFLLKSKNISPSLSADAKILTEIYQKIFNESPNNFTFHDV